MARFILFIALVCVWQPTNGLAQSVQTEFVIGTFFDPPLNPKERSRIADSTSFSLAREAHFNLLTGTQSWKKIDRSFTGMSWALEMARANGLRYMVTDGRIYPVFYYPPDSTKAERLFREYAFLPDSLRDVIFAYNLGDEPHFDSLQFSNALGWKGLVEMHEPEKPAYINLAPSFAVDMNWGGFQTGNSNGRLDEAEKAEYEQYLAWFVDSLNPGIVSFDHYPFLKNGRVRRDYFYNLEIIRKKAGSRPIWAHPMTVGHLGYVDPTPEHVRFMYFCPIAYGATGLVVFTFWPPDDEGYRDALFDKEGRKVERFETVRRLNSYVADVLAPVLLSSDLLGIYHASTFPQSQLFVSDLITGDSEILKRISDPQVMASVFRDSKDTYLFVVNKGLNPVEECELVLDQNIHRVRSGPTSEEFGDGFRWSFKLLKTQRTTRSISVLLPKLSGGDVMLLKLDFGRSSDL